MGDKERIFTRQTPSSSVTDEGESTKVTTLANKTEASQANSSDAPPATSIMEAEAAIDAEAEAKKRAERELREHQEYVEQATGKTDGQIYFNPTATAGLGYRPHLQASEEKLKEMEDAHKEHDSKEAPVDGCVICDYEVRQAEKSQSRIAAQLRVLSGAQLEQRAALGAPVDAGGEAGTAGTGQTTSTSGDTATTGGGAPTP